MANGDSVIRASRCGFRHWGVARLVAVSAVLAALLPGRSDAQALSGSYVGDGVDGRAISGLGFQPDVVIIKADDGKVSVIRTSTMAGDMSKAMSGAADLEADLIQALDADGFTVGGDDRVNKAGVTLYWTAFKAAAGALKVSTYTGNGLATQAVAGVGFSPELVIVLGALGKEVVFRTSASTDSFEFDNSTNASWFSSLNADGFTVGTDDRVNKAATTYHYLAFNEVAGRFDVGSYAGNGVDGRSLTGVGLAPEYLIVRESGQKTVQRTESMGTAADTAAYFSGNANVTNRIQGLHADGFQVGTDNEANGSGHTYVYLAWAQQRAIIVSPISALTTTEGGGTATFTVVLNSQPASDVTVGLTSGDTTEGTVSPSSVTFTNANWSTPQTVTITGVDDVYYDGNLAFAIVTAPASSTDGDFSGLNASDVSVTNLDSEGASASAGPNVLSGSYVGDGVDGRAISGLGFQPDVVIIKADDGKVSVIRTSTMAGDMSKAMSGAADLEADLIQALDADGFTVGGDDRVNKAGVTLYWTAFKAAAGALKVSTYTGNGLATQAVAGVGFSPELVIVLGALGKEVVFRTSASTDSFEFDNSTNASWFSSLNADGFTVGTDDRVNKAATTYHYLAFNEVAGRFDVGSYAGNGVDGRSLTGVGLAPEYLIVRESGQKTVQRTESMGTAADTAAYFSANANATNRIQGLHADGFQVGTNNEANGSGQTYVYLAWAQQTPPSVSGIADRSTAEDTPTAAIGFTVGDAETAAASLTVSGTSSNTTLVPNANIVFGGSGTSRTVTLTPAANQWGSATITVSVSDGVFTSVTAFVVTVTPVADTPPVTNATTSEDTQSSSGLVISRNAADGAEVTHFKITGVSGGTLYKNDGTTAIANGTFITFAEGNAGLKFTPTPNSTVSGAFTVQASRLAGDSGLGGSTANATVTVTPVADTPAVTDATTNEDTQSSTGLVISRSAVDGAEVTHFKITGIMNGTLHKNDGTTPVGNGAFVTFAEGNAGLKFTPASDFSGNGSFTIQASTSGTDPGLGGGTVVATITVTAVNDPPTISDVVDQRTMYQVATGAIPVTISDDETAANSLTLTAASSNTTLVPNGNIVLAGSDGNRTVTVTPANGQSGTTTITLTVSDGTDTTQDTFVLSVSGITVSPTSGLVTTEAGGTATFTVVLAVQPLANVTVNLSSSDTTEGVVAPASLTFTAGNWNAPQTVTVTGVDDAGDDGDVTYTIVTAAATSADGIYNGLNPGDVSATTVDNDAAGLTVTESGGATSVTEAGTTDTVTVVLTAQPASNVVVTVTSGDAGEATVGPATLTFTTANWNTPQTVTVTGVNDALADGDQVTTLTVAVDDAASSNEFDAVADATVSATTVDNDSAGITLAESGGATSVTEAGTTDTVTVVLTAQPASDVVLTVTSADAGEATVSPATLTFTSANWNSPQTVTVTGVNDALADGNQVTTLTMAVDDASSSNEFDAVVDATVGATTVDNDAAGITVTESGGSTSVTEAGTTDTFTVVLTAQPASDVVLTVTSGDTGEATVGPATLTFTSANWNSPQTVTVTGVNDALADGNQVTTLTMAVDDATSSNEFDTVADAIVGATTVDNDAAGITLAESGGTTSVTEAGTTDTFTVVLTAQPASDVVLTVTSADAGEATVGPATLIFTSANWNSPQTVTVTGVNDALADGNQVTTLTVAVDDAGSSNEFDAVADASVSATTVDNDAAGITVTESGGATSVTEAGTTDTVTVVLTAQPASDVVLTVTSGDAGEATVGPATLTFTTANWNTPQTVTVTGVNDALADGNQVTTLTVAVDDAASSNEFHAVADATVSATTVDNDAAGLTVTESGGGTSVNESGTTDTFTVVLTAQPASDVVLTVTSGDAGEAAVSPATLTFTSANWNTPQTVTVTGVNDALADGNQVTTLTVAVDDAASSNEFDAVADATVSATTVDNDAAEITVTESGGATSVTEAGTTDTVTVVLTAQPASDVVLTVTSGDAGEATVSPATLTFTSANWNSPQTVTVTGVNDALADGNQVTTVTVAVDDATSSNEFDAVADATVSATTVDNDAAGLTVTESGGSTSVNESATIDTFTVVLTAQPASDVVLTVASGDAGEATVSPATLTFTSANWNSPQTVTVTGVNDALADGNQATTLTVAVDDATSSNEFDAVADATVSATTVDNDAAGITLAESGGSTSVTEAGTTDTFTVVLTAQPASDVVLTVTSGDAGEATVSPATLTFTPANWSTPQTVTATGIDELLVDGNQLTTVTVAVDDAASSNEFDAAADATVSATTVDNDAAGIIVAESGGATSVTEAGTTDTFTVVLTAQPASDVVLTVASGDTGEATVSPATLTFTPANWNTPQTVTVTGVNDALADGDQVTTLTVAVDDATSSNEFDAVADATVSATTVDDDAAGLTVTESGGATSVTEAGTTDTVTVVLTAQPASDVVLTVTSADAGEATVSPATLTFTPANWNSPQTVTVTGVNDALADGNQVTTLTVSVDDAASSNEFDAVADATVSATTVDNDSAGITLAESGGATSVTETGTTDTVTVVLTAQPASDVVLTVSSADAGEATVGPATLTFTGANWNSPQTVTVTGVNDALADGNQVTTVTVAVDDATSSNEFDAVADATVSATTVDDDAAGITVTESGGATSVTEAGTTDTFTVVLTAQPASDVVLTVTSGDAGEATVSPATLTFTSANWNSPQTVTVTGVNDALADGNQVTTLTMAVDDASSSNGFDAVVDATVGATTVDNDAAGITVTESGGSTSVTEAGTTDTFTVVLTAQPASDVVLTVTSGDTGEATVGPATLTFTSANWNSPQTVTVTGVNDALADGNQVTTLTMAVDDATSSNEFDTVADAIVGATTVDNDAAGITLAESGGTTSVTEAGTTDTFTVVLTAQPASDVVLTVTSADAGEATVGPATLIFTSANWNSPQTVTVTGVNDALADGNQVTTLTVAVDDAGSSNEFDAVADASVSATTVDNDAAGITVTESGGATSVTEAGTTDTFTVVLTAQPASDVVLTVTSGDAGEATVGPATLTFTAANWNGPQTVTVTGVNDALADGNQVTTLTVAVDDAGSSNEFDAVADASVSATTVDNDAAGLTVTESGGATSVTEAGTTDTFTVVLTAQPASDVVLTVTSGDAGEATVGPATLTFTSANWNSPQTVTVTGVNDALADGNQVTTVTVAVDDASSSNEFDTVADATVGGTTVDNDAAGITLAESGGTTSVTEAGTTDTFTVVLTAQPASDVVLTVTSADAGEATVGPATLTFTPANWSTPQTVTVTGVNDALADGNQVTTVTVAVDDATSSNEFDAVADATVSATTVDNDAAGMTVTESGGATSVTEAGTTDTLTVVLTAQPASDVVLTVTSGDTGEATVGPATLTFTSANWNTPQTVTVTGVNDALADGNQITTVTVAVDDATSSNEFDAVADATVSATTVDNDAAGMTVTESGGATSVTEAGTTDTFTVVLTAQPASDVVLTVTSGDAGEATVSPATLTFTAANWNSPQTVTVTGVNDALADGNQVTTLTVAVDDATSSNEFDAVADATVSATTVDNDAAGMTVTESGGSTSVTEAGTTDTLTVVLTAQPASDVVLTVTSGDAGEATVSPATLTFTSANWNTPQTVTVTGVNDALADGNQVTTLTVAVDDATSSNEFDAVADATVSATTVDNDAAGITVTESGGATSVTEAGTTDTVTVVLTAQPASDVVLTVTSGDAGEATVGPATLTFTSANWNSPQTVTVTGVNDALADGNRVTTLTMAVDDASSSNEFDAVADATVSATTVDNDAAGITVTESGGSTSVNESGTTDTFTVVLTAQPASDVVLTVASGDAGKATVSPATLTFTSANWNSPQTVTVTGVNDALADGNQVTTLTVAVDDATSSNEFDAVADATVSATTVDNDSAGITLAESGGATSVTEAGTTDTFTVVLTAQPASDVVLTVASGDAGEATVSPATLTFTSANWNSPQTVTVTGVNDALADGNQVTTLTVAVDDATSSNEFDAVADATVSATTVDNDSAGITLAESGGATSVTEAGTTDTFTVVLTAQPASDVVLTVTSGDAGEATVSPATLTFTSANWNTPQTVTVTGVNDALADGNQVTTVTVAVDDATSSNEFDAVADATVSATTVDNDAAGITVTESGGATSVTEAGTTDTFTVVLTAQPASDVVLTVTSGDAGEATVGPATLTFTSANWNSPQTVTVTGVNDALADGNQVTTLTMAVDDASSSNEFDAVVDATVGATTVDNDAAGITVTESGGSTSVTEAGTTDTFTVVLTAQPASDVVLTVTSGDAGEATVSPATLTFTPATWSTPQTVTVTGIDDLPVDGNQLTTLTVAVDDAASSNEFDAVADATVSATTVDNDAAGITVTESGGATSVTEAGTTDTFTVVLTAQPASDVVLTVTSGDAGEATVSPATLTFTSANWNSPQTVTVTGVNDALADGNQVTTVTVAVDDASSSNDFDAVADASVSATTVDDDAVGITLAESGGSTSVTEAGTTDTFTVVLTAQPASDVVLTVTSGDAGEATVSPATLTFTPANWSTPQTVTATGVDELLVDGNQLTTVTVAVDDAASSNEFDAVADATVSATTVDNDAAGVSVAPTAGLVTSEIGTTVTFAIVLTAEPVSDVAIALSSSNVAEGTVAPAGLTFTNANWSTPQTVTVTGVNDPVVDGNQPYLIQTGPVVSTDPAYAGVDPADVSITNTDDDAVGVTINPTTGLTTTEAGGTATFSVVLNSMPTADVTIPLSSADVGEGTVAPASIVVTPANWNTPQVVTLTGIDDAVQDGPQGYLIVTGAATSTDPLYDGLDAADVSSTNADNDTAGVTLNPSGGLTTSESGGTATFTVTLTSQPTADVTIGLSSSDLTEGTVAPADLTFTAGNWSTPQTVTVTGVDDSLDDGDVAYTIVTATASSADALYNGTNAADVTVTSLDDDIPGVRVTPTSGLVATEAGGTATFTVVLDSQPTADVAMTLTSSDVTEGVVGLASLTFTPANWNSPQTVTVAGVDDLVVDGIVAYAIVTGAATSPDPAYNGRAVADVTVSTLDNDVAGILVSPTAGLVTTEAGGTATFTVVLSSQPVADVTVGVSTSDSTEGTAAPAGLTFTAASWNTPQTVTVTGADDALGDGDVAYTIVTAPAASGDLNYSGRDASDVSVVNADNDVAGITVVPTSGLVTPEAGGAATFTVVLDSQPTAAVTIGLGSSDTGEGTVAPASLTFTPANWDTPQTVTVTGVNDALDDGDVVYSIVTAAAVSADAAFNGLDGADVSVTTTDDDSAEITVLPAVGLVTTEAGGTASFAVVLASQPTADVMVALSSSQSQEGSVTPASLVFTPLTWSTPQTVTVTGVDDTVADGSRNYVVATAPAVSGDPRYAGLDAADVGVTNVDDDRVGITVAPTSGLVTSEAGQAATFQVVLNTEPTGDVSIDLASSNAAEATVAPTVLTFTTANWNAPRTVTVTGVDDPVADGSQAYTIVTAPATSTDPLYAGVDPPNVVAANSDDDAAGFTITPLAGLVTSEAGGSATFAVALNTAPVADVTVWLSSSRPGEGVVAPAALTFTGANWNQPRIVTVTGVDDAIPDGLQAYTIVTTSEPSADADYDGIDPPDVGLANQDDDAAGIAVSSLGTLTTSESGQTATFTVVLSAPPAADVFVPLRSTNTLEGLVAPAMLTFGPGNWDVPVEVLVTGVDDGQRDDTASYAIVVGPATSADLAYNGIAPSDVRMRNLDDGTTPDRGTDRTVTSVPALSDTPSSGLPPTASAGSSQPATPSGSAGPPRSVDPDASARNGTLATSGGAFGVPVGANLTSPGPPGMSVSGMNDDGRGGNTPEPRVTSPGSVADAPPAETTGGTAPTEGPPTDVGAPIPPQREAPVTSRLPVLHGFTPRVTAEGTPLVVSSATDTAITMADPDGTSGPVFVTLVARHGTLSLAGLRDIQVIDGRPFDAGSVTVSGDAKAISGALDGLVFKPEANYSGAAGLCMDVSYRIRPAGAPSLCSDNAGVESTDQREWPRAAVWMLITVTPVDDPPTISPIADVGVMDNSMVDAIPSANGELPVMRSSVSQGRQATPSASRSSAVTTWG